MKAQITMFIIIGLLIVIAFGIAIYVGASMRKGVQKEPSQQRIEQLGVQPVFDYVVTCLTLATNEGLALLGMQGGVLYKSQGGVTPDYLPEDKNKFYVQSGDTKTQFDVVPPEGMVCQDVANPATCSFFSAPPKYPFEGFPGPQLLFFGYYGESRLPPLYRGINPETGQPVQNSIQESLESFIAKRTIVCADFKSFENRFTISYGNAVAKLLFAENVSQFIGEQNVNVELDWPVDVSAQSGKTLLDKFAVKIPVRLATVYYTAKGIIDADVTDVSYKPNATETFTVSTVRLGDNSLVILRDSQSLVQGKPFEFWIARKNRIPALWFIDTSPLNDVEFHVSSGKNAEVKVVQIDGENAQLEILDPCQAPGVSNPFVIKLRASDPDENDVTFSVHIPASSTNEIPDDAANNPFEITVFAKDGNIQQNWDSQAIPLKVVQCPVR